MINAETPEPMSEATQTLIDGVYAWKSLCFERDTEIERLRSLLSLLIEKAEPFAHYYEQAVRNEYIEEHEPDEMRITIKINVGDLRALSEAVSKVKEGNEMVQADSVPADSSEKFIGAAEWLPIETAPKGEDILLAIMGIMGGKPYVSMGMHVFEPNSEGEDKLNGEAGFWTWSVGDDWMDEEEYGELLLGWMPLPSPPSGRVNFSNEPESDAVSLNQTTSFPPPLEGK